MVFADVMDQFDVFILLQDCKAAGFLHGNSLTANTFFGREIYLRLGFGRTTLDSLTQIAGASEAAFECKGTMGHPPMQRKGKRQECEATI